MLSAGEASSKFMFYEHEDLGRMLAAVAAAVIMKPTRGLRPIGSIVAGGVLLGAAALTHLIQQECMFTALIGGVLIARIALFPGHARTAKLAGGTALIAVALTATPLAAAKGEIGFEGAGSPEKYTLFRGKKDPTAAVKGLRRSPSRIKSESRWYKPPLTTTRLAAEAAVGRDLTRIGAAAF